MSHNNNKKCIENNGSDGAFLTDLSKTVNCLSYDFLIMKLHQYGFSYNVQNIICCYLTDQKQRVGIDDTVSNWVNISVGVPQGTTSGPLLDNIFLNYILLCLINSNIRYYADDNTPCLCNRNEKDALNGIK